MIQFQKLQLGSLSLSFSFQEAKQGYEMGLLQFTLMHLRLAMTSWLIWLCLYWYYYISQKMALKWHFLGNSHGRLIRYAEILWTQTNIEPQTPVFSCCPTRRLVLQKILAPNSTNKTNQGNFPGGKNKLDNSTSKFEVVIQRDNWSIRKTKMWAWGSSRIKKSNRVLPFQGICFIFLND